jgi:hypothetical protein
VIVGILAALCTFILTSATLVAQARGDEHVVSREYSRIQQRAHVESAESLYSLASLALGIAGLVQVATAISFGLALLRIPPSILLDSASIALSFTALSLELRMRSRLAHVIEEFGMTVWLHSWKKVNGAAIASGLLTAVTALVALANLIAPFRSFVNEWIAASIAMLVLHAVADVKVALRDVRRVSVDEVEIL